MRRITRVENEGSLVSQVFADRVKKFERIIDKWSEGLKTDKNFRYVMKLAKDYPIQFRYTLNNRLYYVDYVAEKDSLVFLINFDHAQLTFSVSLIGYEAFRQYDVDFGIFSVYAEDLEDIPENEKVFLSKEELIDALLDKEKNVLLSQSKNELVNMILGYKRNEYIRVNIEDDVITEQYTYDDLLRLYHEIPEKDKDIEKKKTKGDFKG